MRSLPSIPTDDEAREILARKLGVAERLGYEVDEPGESRIVLEHVDEAEAERIVDALREAGVDESAIVVGGEPRIAESVLEQGIADVVDGTDGERGYVDLSDVRERPAALETLDDIDIESDPVGDERVDGDRDDEQESSEQRTVDADSARSRIDRALTRVGLLRDPSEIDGDEVAA